MIKIVLKNQHSMIASSIYDDVRWLANSVRKVNYKTFEKDNLPAHCQLYAIVFPNHVCNY